MKNEIKLEFNTYIIHRIFQIARLSRRAVRQYSKGLAKQSPEQLMLLVSAQFLGKEATPYRISKHFSMEPHTVSATLNAMEHKGLIRKVKDMPKKNMVRIEITDIGNNALNTLPPSNIASDILSALSDEEKRSLLAYSETIVNNLISVLHIRDKNLDVWTYEE